MKNKIIINADDVNVEKIISQIHENMKSRGYDIDELRKYRAGLAGIRVARKNKWQTMRENLNALNSTYVISYWWQFPRTNSPIECIKNFIKKVVRKLNFFYLKHTFDQQNIFNANAVMCINALDEKCRELEEKYKNLKLLSENIENINIGFNDIFLKEINEYFKEYDKLIFINNESYDVLNSLNKTDLNIIDYDYDKLACGNLDLCEESINAIYISLLTESIKDFEDKKVLSMCVNKLNNNGKIMIDFAYDKMKVNEIKAEEFLKNLGFYDLKSEKINADKDKTVLRITARKQELCV